MSETPPRFIHRRGASAEIADLLQAIFLGELIRPSSKLFLISPWVSNIPILDNRAQSFSALEPSWTQPWVRLVQVLERLLSDGCSIVLATRPDEHNKPFLRALEEAGVRAGSAANVHIAERLHEKGLLGDDFYLSGSMNFTFNGISINEEFLQLHIDESVVAQNRGVLADRWTVATNV
jgi:hypothetical protein